MVDNTRIELKSARGSFGLRVMTPELIVATFRGYCDTSLGQAAIHELTPRVTARPQVLMFTDCELMTGYASEVRIRFTQWAKTYQAHIGPGHILVRSKLVAMAISVVSLATGRPNNNVHTSRGDFERALATAVAQPSSLRRRSG